MRGIRDKIEINNTGDPVDVLSNVQDALDRYSLVGDDSLVEVDTDEHRVTLSGNVRTRAERDAVVDALALIDIAAGIVAIAYPNITAITLVLIIAFWAIAFGVLELFAAFGAGETAGSRAWFVIGGLVSIVFGVVLASRPDAGAISLAVIYGIFSLAFGITQIVLGVQARRGAVAGADRLATA